MSDYRKYSWDQSFGCVPAPIHIANKHLDNAMYQLAMSMQDAIAFWLILNGKQYDTAFSWVSFSYQRHEIAVLAGANVEDLPDLPFVRGDGYNLLEPVHAHEFAEIVFPLARLWRGLADKQIAYVHAAIDSGDLVMPSDDAEMISAREAVEAFKKEVLFSESYKAMLDGIPIEDIIA